MKKFDVIVAGGCSAGLAAAIGAKRLYPQLNIAVLEKLPRVGKKILATGNGKCNLTNLNALSHEYRNRDFANGAFNKYPPGKIVEFFDSMGLLCYADGEGRVYPRSNTASSVLDALRFEAERLGVEMLTDTPVTQAKKQKGLFVINDMFCAEKLILACGGKASPSQGSDGSGYPFAKTFGHSLTKLYPALVPLSIADDITKSMKGMRARNVLLTLENGNVIQQSRGEILFSDYGLSGIAAMELAAEAENAIASGKGKTFTRIDFEPDMTEDEIISHLKHVRKINGLRSLDALLNGLLPKAIGIAICKACKLYKSDTLIKCLTDSDLVLIAEKLKDFPLEVKGTKGFANAQVTGGGIKVDEINPETMESKLCKGLYFAGEIIDVHGGCGGFNLQWAWASGLLAGELK